MQHRPGVHRFVMVSLAIGISALAGTALSVEISTWMNPEKTVAVTRTEPARPAPEGFSPEKSAPKESERPDTAAQAKARAKALKSQTSEIIKRAQAEGRPVDSEQDQTEGERTEGSESIPPGGSSRNPEPGSTAGQEDAESDESEGPATTEPGSSEPAPTTEAPGTTEPAPGKPDPKSPDPTNPDPAQPDPTTPDPTTMNPILSPTPAPGDPSPTASPSPTRDPICILGICI